MTKGILYQDNIYTPNQEALKYTIKQLLTELKGDADKNTNIVKDINILQTAIDRSKQKINKAILALKRKGEFLLPHCLQARNFSCLQTLNRNMDFY